MLTKRDHLSWSNSTKIARKTEEVIKKKKGNKDEISVQSVQLVRYELCVAEMFELTHFLYISKCFIIIFLYLLKFRIDLRSVTVSS